jgi:hypothetical protein
MQPPDTHRKWRLIAALFYMNIKTSIMNWKTIILLIIWIALAVINIVSLWFAGVAFFTVCNIIFACYNAVMALALVPQVWVEVKRLRKGE